MIAKNADRAFDLRQKALKERGAQWLDFREKGASFSVVRIDGTYLFGKDLIDALAKANTEYVNVSSRKEPPMKIGILVEDGIVLEVMTDNEKDTFEVIIHDEDNIAAGDPSDNFEDGTKYIDLPRCIY